MAPTPLTSACADCLLHPCTLLLLLCHLPSGQCDFLGLLNTREKRFVRGQLVSMCFSDDRSRLVYLRLLLLALLTTSRTGLNTVNLSEL